MITIISVVQFIMCFLCCKWRWIGSYFIYSEILIHTSSLFYPNSTNYNQRYSTYLNATIMLAFSHYCGQIQSIYLLTAMLSVQLYFGIHVAYLRPFEAINGISCVITVTTSFFVLSFIYSGLFYLSKLQK